MATALSTFKAALAHGGARPSLFDISISTATNVSGMTDAIETLCNVSAIPPLTITPIERQYFGRTVKIPGDIVFGDLTTSIINTEDMEIKQTLEEWMEAINGAEDNIGYSDSTSMYGDVILTQYSKDGDPLMHWTFVDCWPTAIAEVALSYDTASDIEQFDVTWAYNYYTQEKGSSTHIDATFSNQE
tara:strand:+ start:269 stop:829 length:561 start_codon:yes stop_codon:yes gene_type:complete